MVLVAAKESDTETRTVDSGWADNSCLDDVLVLGGGLKHNLVNVAMESMVGQSGQLANLVEVIIDLV